MRPSIGMLLFACARRLHIRRIEAQPLFVRLSTSRAEDIFRPVIPARYITTKREAELGIEEIIRDKSDSFRAAYIRL